jgi:hypothetical protein
MRPGEDRQLPSQFEFKRRVGQILRETAAQILAGLQATGLDGVYCVRCGDGIVRKIRIQLGGWLTDREEHEVCVLRVIYIYVYDTNIPIYV